MFKRRGSTPTRTLILPDELQSAIAGAVRRADPACQMFVGVLVERQALGSTADANWIIKGVRFGKADRAKAGSVLAAVVERMQQEFNLCDEGR